MAKHSDFLIFLILFPCLLISGCAVQNKFNPPNNLPNDSEKKRLVIFLASDIGDQSWQQRKWAPNCILMARPGSGKFIVDLESSPGSYLSTTVWEWNAHDTGSITFLMAIGNGNRKMARKLFTDTTINLDDLHPGNNYWHLNYYNERKMNGLIPVIVLRNMRKSSKSKV